jgi:hypothetical protein
MHRDSQNSAKKDQRKRTIKRRSKAETERELRAAKEINELPGGADGGDESPAADRPPGAPAKEDKTPLGDTDQHSSSERLPPQRRN